MTVSSSYAALCAKADRLSEKAAAARREQRVAFCFDVAGHELISATKAVDLDAWTARCMCGTVTVVVAVEPVATS